MFILQVTIDGLGHTDHLHAGIMSLVVLGQDGCIGVAVITTDNHYSRDFELAQDIQTSLASDNPIVRMFAVLDRRVGKRTLEKLKDEIDRQPEWLQYFYRLRLGAETGQKQTKEDCAV